MELIILQLVSTEFIIDELVALILERVELETFVLFRFTFVKLIGRLVVELKIEEVPLIPKRVDDAIVGNNNE